MAKKQARPAKSSFPSTEALEVLVDIAECVGLAKSRNHLCSLVARRHGGTRQRVEQHLEKLEAHCGGVVEFGRNQPATLTRDGEHLLAYAKTLVDSHRAIRDWPPVCEIVIGSTQMSASYYLPVFLEAFYARLKEEEKKRLEELRELQRSLKERPLPGKAINETGRKREGGLEQVDLWLNEGAWRIQPPQVRVEESDTLEVFKDKMRANKYHFGLRGRFGDEIPKEIYCLELGRSFDAVLLCKHEILDSRIDQEGKTVATVEDLRMVLHAGQRVAIRRINVPNLTLAMQKAGHPLGHVVSGLIICESVHAVLELVERGVAYGILPDDARHAHLRHYRMPVLWKSQLCAFRPASFPALKVDFPKAHERWFPVHYQKLFWSVFRDRVVQREAGCEAPDEVVP